ncbi:uncharacterized protein LOC107635794 [Arachis ipaensis]|uniref:uncharacterized protein LOC107635794 n=1 Tax=Arachis ipaensis TaxID=130454 RepID=UPI0007AF7740|nr:uncharacterized protein LOC107635794 [Arachis ipaensis]XP_025645003.1 uncharacterized protein LOC112740564 [Arachis hypogaea]
MVARALKVLRERLSLGVKRHSYTLVWMPARKGFKEGCKPLIGLDGCFLKGRYGGQLLSAVGQDANNHFYVIAYTVVPNECKDTWKWFFTLLKEDLGEVPQHGWNFISDQQKGLELAMKEVNPTVHHRNCVLHIWKNFIKHFKDEQTNRMVWECSRCTTFQEFSSAMEKLKKLNEGAWEYLQRKKPIMSMCGDLRCYIMKKRAMHKKRLENHIGILAPVQQKKLYQFIKPKSTKWRAIWAGDSDRILFEVHMQRHMVGVNLQSRTSTYNVWQLTGMYCRHAVATMAKKMGLKPENFVHKWFTMDAIRPAYSHCINPVNSEEYWTPTDSPQPLPPQIKKAAHRSKIKRKVDSVKTEMHSHKAKKTFEVTCNKCGQTSHYYKTCSNPPKDPNWKPMTKKEMRDLKKSALVVDSASTTQVASETPNLNNPPP